jgi:hypothetical protein
LEAFWQSIWVQKPQPPVPEIFVSSWDTWEQL